MNIATAVIPRNVKLSECPSFGKPIILYDIESKGSEAYLALAKEYLIRERSKGEQVKDKSEIPSVPIGADKIDETTQANL